MFDAIEQMPDPNRQDDIRQVEMTIRKVDSSSETNIFYLNPDYLGPLGDSDEKVKKWLRGVWYFELGFSFRTYMPANFQASETCYLWKL